MINLADYIATIEGDPIFQEVPIERIKEDFLDKYGLTHEEYNRLTRETLQDSHIHHTTDGPIVTPSKNLPRSSTQDTEKDRINNILALKKIGLTNIMIVHRLGIDNKEVQRILNQKKSNLPRHRANTFLSQRREEYLVSAGYGE